MHQVEHRQVARQGETAHGMIAEEVETNACQAYMDANSLRVDADSTSGVIYAHIDKINGEKLRATKVNAGEMVGTRALAESCRRI